MYVTDTPVIDRLINPEPMEELYCAQDDLMDLALNEGFCEACEGSALRLVDEFIDQMATRLAAIQ